MNIQSGAFRRTKLDGWYEFMRQTCPVCHKAGGCIIHEKGDRVACIRIQSDIQFGKGSLPSWLHYIKDGVKIDVAHSRKVSTNRSKLPENMLHRVYSSMINHYLLALTDNHLQHLKNRGITMDTITTRGYSSFPEKPWNVAKDVLPEQLVKRLSDPKFTMGIPGFYKNKYGWSITGMEGILIPYRNENNWIIGFQIRVDNPKNDVEVNSTNYPGLQARVKEQPNLVQILDDGEIIFEREFKLGEVFKIERGGNVGTVKLKTGQRYFWLSSANKELGTGAGDPIPVHVAVPTYKLKEWNKAVAIDMLSNNPDANTTLKTESVWVTEGALKADIAVDHIVSAFKEELNTVGDTMLAIAGINSWRELLPVLQNMGVKRVNIAFDMDAISNKYVKMHYMEMVAELKKLGYDIYVALWNPENKGIDDTLSAGYKPELRKI